MQDFSQIAIETIGPLYGEQDVVHNSTSEIVVINITEGLKDRLHVRKYRADEIWT